MTTTFVNALGDKIRAVSEAIEDARRREEALRAEYADRQRQLAEEATRLEAQLKHLNALVALESGDVPNEPAILSPSPDSRTFVNLREEVFNLLSEVRQPLHYRRIAEQLALRGVDIPGQDPAKNLVAHIHDDTRFKRPKRGFYGLSEWYPADMQTAGARRTTRGKGKATKRRSSG